MMILDDTSPSALAVDTSVPPSAAAVHDALVEQWPRLAGRVRFDVAPLESVALAGDDLVLSIHACGALSDLILDRAVAVRARVAILPCCHNPAVSDTGALTGWLDEAMAIDVVRAHRLADRGYRVWTQQIPGDITSKNRLLIGAPLDPLPQG